MAVTQNSYTGNGSTTTYSFTFPYLKTSEIKASLNSVVTTAFTTPTATTIQFNTAPSSGDKILIYRETDGDSLAATFYAGSAIKSEDLNDNFTQNLYGVQEVTDRFVNKLGGSTMTGDLLLGEDVKITFEGATDNTYETNLTVADPTADRTITLPNETGTVITSAGIDVIDSAHYVAGSIDLEHMSANSVDSDQYVDGSIDLIHMSANSVDSNQYVDGSIDREHLSADIIDGTKIEDDAINSEHYAAGSIDLEHMSANSVDSDQYVDGSIDSAHIANDQINSQHYAAGSIDEEHYANGSITSAKLNASAVVTNAEQSGASVNDTSFFTTSASDARYFNISSGDTIKDGDSFPDNDTTIATTAAINDRIIDLVDDVGGFVPIANETSFPAANPDVNNGAGTLISVKEFSSSHTPSSGTVTIANGAGSGNTVTITGCGSTVLSAGFGAILETTTTLHTYTFHRLSPKSTEVTTVAGISSNITTVAGIAANVTTVATNNTNVTTVATNIANVNSVAGSISNVNSVASNISDVNNFNDLYQIATSAPTTDGGSNALAAGDLWFDSSSNKTLKVHNGTSFQSVSPTQSVLDDISIVSGSLTRTEDLGSIADAIASDSSTGALDTCATNISNINTFSNVYRIAANAPSSSLDEGDLWYDSTGNTLKYYNGTAWTVTAAAGLSEIVEDTTPALGGHLDCNDKNLTEVGTVSGNNLQIDFGTLS